MVDSRWRRPAALLVPTALGASLVRELGQQAYTFAVKSLA
jgi:hypothetical protein